MTAAGPWLLLLHQLPAHPVNLRVKTWRRLQQLGAVAVKHSVYALPNRSEAREDFEWIRKEIVAAGGQATVFEATTVDSLSSDELRDTFRREREKDYRALTRATGKAVREATSRTRRDPRAFAKALRTWRARLSAIEALDYFGADGRDEARAEVARLSALAPGGEAAAPAAQPGVLDAAAFQRRRWVTRLRPGVDRMASAWLIRRFIDPQAVFGFVAPNGPRVVGALTFDMFEGDFTHEGNRCTFETLCARFGLADAALARVAELVHDLDLKDHRVGRPDVVLGGVIEGLQKLYDSDDALLEQGITLFEALYRGHAASLDAPERTKVASRADSRRKKMS